MPAYCAYLQWGKAHEHWYVSKRGGHNREDAYSQDLYIALFTQPQNKDLVRSYEGW